MRVVLTHTDLRIYWPARLHALQRELARHGHDLRVIEIAGLGSPYAFARMETDRPLWWDCLFPERTAESVRGSEARRALWRRLDETDPAVVVAGAIAFPSGATALAWGRRRRRGVVIMDNARQADVPRGPLTQHVKRHLYALVDGMLLPSPAWADDYEAWGVPRRKQFYGLNVIDDDAFATRAEEARREAPQRREALGLPPQFFLGVGRQIRCKRWETLVDAYGRYRRAGGTWGLVLVGNGPERSTLEARVGTDAVGAVSFVDFLEPGPLTELYGLASALVLPSEQETWGLVVNEAMASGLPVLVSRTCGCASTLVRDGQNGWTFDAGDVDALTERMCQIGQASEATLRSMAASSREIVRPWGLERFAVEASAAIEQASRVGHPPVAWVDRMLLWAWRGRYRPT